MTLSSNAFTTFGAIGNREHLSNMIYNVSPSETPFLSSIEKVKTTSTKHEWQTDALAAAGTNYTLEGDEVTVAASVATARRYNYVQELTKTAKVSGTQEKVAHAGRASEMAYQLQKQSRALMNDMELAALDNNASVAGNTTTAREMAGVSAWITTNYDKNGATNPTGDGTDAWSGGTAIALTEGRFKNALQRAWSSGGSPDACYTDAFNRNTIDTFSGNGTRMIKAEGDKLQASFSVYASPFGDIKIIPSRNHESGHILILDTAMWKYAELEGPRVKPLAVSGDYEANLIIAKGTVEACNEKASAIIVNVTTS